MLVLSRREGERILIWRDSGEVIEVQVTSVGKGRVRIGITAPEEWKIAREEVAKDVPQRRLD